MRFRACLFLVAAALCLSAQRVPTVQSVKINAAVSSKMSQASIPGVTVAIGSADGLYWDSGFGMADLENLAMMNHVVVVVW